MDFNVIRERIRADPWMSLHLNEFYKFDGLRYDIDEAVALNNARCFVM